MTHQVGLFGLRVQSDFTLPDWPAQSAPGPADLRIIRGSLSGPLAGGPTYSVKSLVEDRELLLGVSGVGRYKASGGNLITVDPDPEARAEDVLLYLTGVVLAAILHQRGILPLHASCVARDGMAIALAGTSGAGKSTLLAALVGSGWTFVSDDICVLAARPEGGFGVWPSLPRAKLDESALAIVAQPKPERESAGGNRGKFILPLGSASRLTEPTRLGVVYLLQEGNGTPRFERLEGLEAVSALVAETYYLAHAAALGLANLCFTQAASLARDVQVLRLIRPRGFEHLPSVVALLEAAGRD